MNHTRLCQGCGAFFNTKNHVADNHIRVCLRRAAARADEDACLNIAIHARLGITTPRYWSTADASVYLSC